MSPARAEPLATAPGDPERARRVAPMEDAAEREAAVQAIARELRCLVCQNESVAESRSALARDLKRWLHERLAAGVPRQQILDELVLRYGDFIRYSPPVDARTLPLWAAPGVLVGGGALALAWIVRRRQRLPDALEDADDDPDVHGRS